MPIPAVGRVMYQLGVKRRLCLCVQRADGQSRVAPRGWDACPRADRWHSRNPVDASRNPVNGYAARSSAGKFTRSR